MKKAFILIIILASVGLWLYFYKQPLNTPDKYFSELEIEAEGIGMHTPNSYNSSYTEDEDKDESRINYYYSKKDGIIYSNLSTEPLSPLADLDSFEIISFNNIFYSDEYEDEMDNSPYAKDKNRSYVYGIPVDGDIRPLAGNLFVKDREIYSFSGKGILKTNIDFNTFKPFPTKYVNFILDNGVLYTDYGSVFATDINENTLMYVDSILSDHSRVWLCKPGIPGEGGACELMPQINPTQSFSQVMLDIKKVLDLSI